MARECPLCGARAWGRDYAPARTYAILLFGVGLILLGRIILPSLAQLVPLAHMKPDAAKFWFVEGFDPAMLLTNFISTSERLFQGGVVICFLAVFDFYIQENRFCVSCGLRVRRRRKQLDAKTMAALEAITSPNHEKHSAPSSRKSSAPAPAATVGARQSIMPLIKLLNAKSEKMRSDALETLKTVTGEDFGFDAEAWEEWHRENN